jgi:bacterioferritin (cytochrome b1)
MNAFEELRKLKSNSEGNAFDALRNLEPVTATEVPKPIPFEGPQQIAPPISMPTPQEAANIQSYPQKQSVFDKGYVGTLLDEAASGSKLMGEGLDQILKGQSATGAGKVAIGVLQGTFSPIAYPFKVLEEVGDKIAPGFGAKLAVALPIKSTSALVKSKLPSEIAIKTIVDNIGVDKLSDVISQLKSNPRLSIMDTNDEILQMGQRLAVIPGPHRQSIWDFNKNRMDTTKTVVRDIFDENLGMTVDAHKRLQEMKAAAQKTGAEKINPLVEGAKKPADVREAVQLMSDEFGKGPVARATFNQIMKGEPITGPALSSYQKILIDEIDRLRGDWKGPYIDVMGEQGLHQKQKELRAKAQAMIDSNNSQERADGKRLMKIRQAYVKAIDDVAPGYAKALDKYADDMTIQEYFDKGFKLFSNSTKLENRPEFKIADMERIKKDLPEAFKAMQEGARVAIDSSTRSFRNSARKGEDLVQSEFNQDLLKALYGEAEATKAIKYLNDERAIANTDMMLFRNSQTARREEANQAVELPKNKPFGQKILPGAVAEAVTIPMMQMSTGVPLPGVGVGAFLAGAGINKLANKTQIKLAEKRNKEIVDILTATGENRDTLIKALESYLPNHMPKTQKAIQTIKGLAFPVLPP